MKTLLMFGLLVLAAAAHAAQYFEWVDEKGVKQFTQQPPPPGTKQVQERRTGSNVIQTSGPSFATQLAAKNFPVTLYVTECGEGCTNARAHLTKRGIPFTEKNPQQEFENFNKLTDGGMEIPLLIVGPLKPVKGYNTANWDAIFDQAGYPRSTATAGKPVPESAAPASKPAPTPAAPAPAPQ